jgi:hypothetical protein
MLVHDHVESVGERSLDVRYVHVGEWAVSAAWDRNGEPHGARGTQGRAPRSYRE